MSSSLSSLKAFAAAMKPTGVFLKEWQNKPDHKVLMLREEASSNYIVMKHGLLHLWARTMDLKESQVFIHSRDAMVAQMGEDSIKQLEASLRPTVH